jgi:hypothetical protein
MTVLLPAATASRPPKYEGGEHNGRARGGAIKVDEGQLSVSLKGPLQRGSSGRGQCADRPRVGKPREYDPTAEQARQKPAFDPSLYTFEELEQLYAALELMARRQGLSPPEEGEDVAG